MAGAPATVPPPAIQPLKGMELVLGALMLAVSNFIVVLDTTIANVSVSHIAGGLAVSVSEGTYVITSYAVAEAITVPLTGWLAKRFGTLRTFVYSILLFGLFSALCGFASSLGMLVFGRILQGLAGGPIMPLSQTLMMNVFPKEKQGAAMGLWSMTTLLAPVFGPISGGYICDNWGWGYIFFINIPITLFCSYVIRQTLRRFETPKIKEAIDYVGLGLLVVWVAALQLMLDKGKDYDWFESPFIWTLCIVAVIGFLAFLIWEFTEKNPVVDLHVFRHRGYTASVLTISLAFGSFFSSVVLTPLWLQNYMDYTATWSGFTTAALGVFAVFAAPFAAKLSQKIDPRRLVFCGVLWLGLMTYMRSNFSTDVTHWDVSLPMLLQGIGMPFFFVPLTGLALASVEPKEIASAAGLMSFLRTFSGAIATSIVTTAWEDQTNAFRVDLAGYVMPPEQLAQMMGDTTAAGISRATYQLNNLLQGQAVMLATNHIFQVVSITFVLAATAVWIAPRPKRKADTSGAH